MSHGGDIYTNRIDYDFSVNINPLGMPKYASMVSAASVRNISLYPDIDYSRLRSIIKEHEKKTYNADIPVSSIVVGNGASSIITAIGHFLRENRVYICEPCFTGYKRAFIASKANIIETDRDGSKTGDRDAEPDYGTITDKIISDIEQLHPDAVCLCNPANPSGCLSDTDRLQRLLDLCRRSGTYLITDECFIDFVTDTKRYSMARFLAEYERLIVIRAFTKIYAMPGLRLGYAYFGSGNLADEIRGMMPEWDVSGIAEATGCAAMTDDEGYLFDTRKLITEEREYLSERLSQMGIRVFPSDACYLLIQSDTDLYEKLLEKGILIRKCDDYDNLPADGYYRIAIKTRTENDILINEIERIISQQKDKAKGRS